MGLLGATTGRAQAPDAPLQTDVAVYPPDATRAFSGVDIAVRDDQELVYLGDVRWADSAPRLLQTAVVDSLARAGGEGVQVADEGRLEIAPQGAEGRLVAVGGGGQHRRERGADHGTITLTVPAG